MIVSAAETEVRDFLLAQASYPRRRPLRVD